MEAFQDDNYDISDLLNKTDIIEEENAWVQGIMAYKVDVEPVETRASKRVLKRDAPYSKD
jgi:hypothetical protein